MVWSNPPIAAQGSVYFSFTAWAVIRSASSFSSGYRASRVR
jgi:hypothetical protein